jgi:type IV secretory pathway VirB10-like protein
MTVELWSITRDSAPRKGAGGLMVDRSSHPAAGFTIAIVMTAVVLVACGGPKAAPSPSPSPAEVTLAPARPADAPAEIAPATGQAAAGAPAAAAGAPAAAAPAAAAPAAAASPSPTPDPEEAKRAEQEQRLRAEVAAAKARAEALTAQVNSECPDLKPGEQRHPTAAARCALLKDQAADAVRQYELGKREAQAAGITVP